MNKILKLANAAAALVLGAAFLAAVAASTPARATDLSEQIMVEKGRELFHTVGCDVCHGPYAEGNVGIGPHNRGASERVIRAALGSKESMGFLREEISDTEIKQIAAYYQWLGQLKLIKALANQGRFVPERVEVHPGTKVQLVIVNANVQPHTFTSDGVGFSKITIGGHDDAAVVWHAPEQEGTYSVVCADCRVAGQRLTIAVTTKAPKFVPEIDEAKAVAKPVPDMPQRAAVTSLDKGMVDKGRELFLRVADVGCAGCHGLYAEGDLGIGSYNRGFSETSIRRALKTVEPMAFLAKDLGETEIKHIAAYYQSLAHMQLVKSMVVRGRVVPEVVRVQPGTTLQLVIINKSQRPRTFDSARMGLERFTVPAQTAIDLVWTAPQHPFPGDYSLVCVDCPQRGHDKLLIEVTKDAPRYVPPVELR